MNNDSNYEVVEKRVLGLLGFLLLAISIYFSYDGFDQSRMGGNDYTTLGKVIAVTLAVTFSAVQFILNSRPDKLNPTLIFLGLVAYCYSIYTNYLGAQHILGMSNEMALALAFGLDVAPEPMIAWAFGDPRRGDLIGNVVKIFTSYLTGKPINQAKSSNSQSSHGFNPGSSFKPLGGGGGGGGQKPSNNPNTRPLPPELRQKLGRK